MAGYETLFFRVKSPVGELSFLAPISDATEQRGSLGQGHPVHG